MFSDLCDSLILLLNKFFAQNSITLTLVLATTLITALIVYLLARKYINIKYLFKLILAHCIVLFLFCFFMLCICFTSRVNSGAML